jgi:hypothetical protein
MDTNAILLIGIIAGFICFCMISAGYMVLMALNQVEDFDDVRIPETFELPKKLHEIEEKEKAATRDNA